LKTNSSKKTLNGHRKHRVGKQTDAEWGENMYYKKVGKKVGNSCKSREIKYTGKSEQMALPDLESRKKRE
jgi:hypothetical protein